MANPKTRDVAVGRTGGRGVKHAAVYYEGSWWTLCGDFADEWIDHDELCSPGTPVTCRACKRTFADLEQIMEV